MVELMDSGLKPRSINRKLSTLKTYFRFLKREGIVAVNPAHRISGPKMEKKLPVFVEEKQMDNLLEDIEFTSDFIGTRDKLILELLYATGMRVSELTSLKHNSVDHYNGTIRVLGKRNKERIIPVPEAILQDIKTHLAIKEQEGISFEGDFLLHKSSGKKVNQKVAYDVVNHYLGLVTTLRKKSPHVLRHTFATHMLNNGADLNAIKEILGHASLAATQVYTHNTIEKLKNIHKQAHPRG